MRVALFVACADDAMFPGTGRAVTRLLERLGHEVVFPADQTCCGQLHWTTGYRREAAALARRFTEVFDGAGTIVTPSASCAAAVRTSYRSIARTAGDDALERAAAALEVHELTGFLVDVLGVTDVGARFPHRVAYQPTCHASRGLGVGDRPLRLLRAVRDLELVELPSAEECCGFGGAFAVKNADVSVAMVADKVRHVRDTGADVLCALDNACLAHVGGALSRLRAGVRVAHVAEILASTGKGT
ncbi:(Fe-S)-binding protein [Actinomadura logoneensis]|uniref:(Fe-S)-binding protein n=1 Tax=Actinomadura logoneensis TaxID=2293572 RepID=A0A372JFF7_9ACTN|nr:(Fe-S)-binding protein [Actinomadura logoneensis]RFU38755.1 (Fe-S)-binding protein [Actinomadura logoneensis]